MTIRLRLVVAVALSAQCTDALVNKVTKTLFKKYKKPEDYLAVPLEELQQDIKSIGLYRNKAKKYSKSSAKCCWKNTAVKCRKTGMSW
jgi:endonuclease III